MKKWLYFIFPIIGLVVFLFFYFAHVDEAKKAQAIRLEQIAKKDAEILQLTQQNQQLQATVADTDKSARLSMLLEQEKTRREIYLKQMELAGDDKARQSELQKAYMEQEAEDQREAARIDAEMQKAAVKAQADVARAHAASEDRVKEKLADNTTVNIDATGV